MPQNIKDLPKNAREIGVRNDWLKIARNLKAGQMEPFKLSSLQSIRNKLKTDEALYAHLRFYTTGDTGFLARVD